MKIDISVVSGSYRRLELLKKMIESVRTSIAKGLTYEIIIVGVQDDDETINWCRTQSDIRLIVQPGLQGAISAFNEGCAAARGRWVTLGNDDLTFAGGSITAAIGFMETHPDVGIGLYFTDRWKSVTVDMMPAVAPDGQLTSVPYGGIAICPKWLGDRLLWWSLPNSRTYGGDQAFCCRALESGWKVEPIPGTLVCETIPDDDLNRMNSGRPETMHGEHPDTAAYLKVYPHGPRIRPTRQFDRPADQKSPLRILHAPIFEGSQVQHEQKYGLTRALQKVGAVVEVDYIQRGAHKILEAAEIWKPHLLVLQLHNPQPFGLEHMRKLRRLLPTSTIVNWNGDRWDLQDDPAQAAEYIAMLRHIDLHTGVNQTALDDLAAQGVPTAYWQIGYEPEGVGVEPDADDPYDVVFLGNGYSASRRRFGDVLKTLPGRVAVVGSGWENLAALPACVYDFRAGCRYYRRARLALGDSEWATSARGFVSNRVFQAMAAGGCLMLQQRFVGHELLHLVDGKHWVLWEDHADLKRKIAYYLSHEKERAEIARAGHLEVLRNHSFDRRVQELLTLLARPKPEPDLTNADPTLTRFHEVRHG